MRLRTAPIGHAAGTLTAPEAASALSRIYAICLLGLDRSFLGRPRSFRVYSGSWKLPCDRPHLAGTACVTLQGMARVRVRQAPAWPSGSDRRAA